MKSFLNPNFIFKSLVLCSIVTPHIYYYLCFSPLASYSHTFPSPIFALCDSHIHIISLHPIVVLSWAPLLFPVVILAVGDALLGASWAPSLDIITTACSLPPHELYPSYIPLVVMPDQVTLLKKYHSILSYYITHIAALDKAALALHRKAWLSRKDNQISMETRAEPCVRVIRQLRGDTCVRVRGCCMWVTLGHCAVCYI